MSISASYTCWDGTSVPSGYEEAFGRYYKPSVSALPQSDAKASCEAVNASLVDVNLEDSYRAARLFKGKG